MKLLDKNKRVVWLNAAMTPPICLFAAVAVFFAVTTLVPTQTAYAFHENRNPPNCTPEELFESQNHCLYGESLSEGEEFQRNTDSGGGILSSMFSGIAYNVVGKISYGLSTIIASVAGIFIAIEAWIIAFILKITSGVADSTPVKNGFLVTLSLANLGFIFAIIVIAIATILRSQTYGIKQLLWKLVIAAILVNFSLAIATAILGFADNLTTFFLKGTSEDFAVKLTGAFEPQRYFLTDEGKIDQKGINKIRDAFNAGDEDVGSMIAPIASIFLVIIMVVLIAITLGALIVMLLARYVVISILLILMPLAWLAWIFPNFRGHWTKWWSTFLRWAMFPPLVLFFLNLGIMASKGTAVQEAADSFAGGSLFAAIKVLFVDALTDLIKPILSGVVVVGLMLGGLIAANKLSITGAGVAMGVARGAGRWAQGAVWKGTKRAGSYALRTETGRRATAALQTAGMGRGRFLRTLARPVREAGLGAAKLRTPTEKEVSAAKRRFGKLSLQEQARRFGTAKNNEERLAIMENLKDAEKSSNRAVRNAAKQAFNSLPADMRGRFDRLRLLYGRGAKAPPGYDPGTGPLEETYAGESSKDKMESAKDKLKKEIEKGEEKGVDVSHKKEIMDALEEIEEMSEDEKESEFDKLKEKIADAIEKEESEGRSTKALEDLEDAVKEQTRALREKPGGERGARPRKVELAEERPQPREVVKFDEKGNPVKEEGGS